MDYIRIPKGAATLPQVAAFAKRVGVHPDHALGMLMRWWATCEESLDSMMGCPGFTEALRHAGWLQIAEDVMQDADGGEQKPRRQVRRKKAEPEVVEQAPLIEAPPAAKTQKTGPTDRELAEQIYLAYPRRCGKPRAITAILSALRKSNYDDLMAATTRYADAVRNSDPRFIPHPSTWYGQERYNDDPSTWRTGSEGKDLFEGIRQIQQESDNGVPGVFDEAVLEGDGVDPGWYSEDGNS